MALDVEYDTKLPPAAAGGSQPWHFMPNQDRRKRQHTRARILPTQDERVVQETTLNRTIFSFLDAKNGDKAIFSIPYALCDSVGKLSSYAATLGFQTQPSRYNVILVQVNHEERMAAVKDNEELFESVKTAIEMEWILDRGPEPLCAVDMRQLDFS